jgi:hypothetical protein
MKETHEFSFSKKDPIFHAKEDENIHSYGDIEKYGIKDISGWLLLKMGKAI